MRSPRAGTVRGCEVRERGQVGRRKIVLVPSILVLLTAILPSVLLVVLEGRSLGFVLGFLALLYVIFLIVMNYATIRRLFGHPRDRDAGGS